MSTELATSEFRFEKRRTAATITLSSGASMRGFFFIAARSTRYEGPERVGDLLNAEPGFFPFEVHDHAGARTVLCNRAHVIVVTLTDDEASRDPGYGVATRRLVSVLVSSGQRLEGAVRVYRPEGRDRLSDWARQPEVFRYIENADVTLVVNAAHIVEVTEVPEA